MCFVKNITYKMKNKQIQGFKVLPLKFSSTSTAYHEIFIKEHAVRNQSTETPLGCTLFVLNLPPYVTEDSLKRIFSVAGSIKNVIFRKSTDNHTIVTGFKSAFVVFDNEFSVLKALKLKNLEPLSTFGTPILCGVEKWTQEYNQTIINPTQLQNEINEYMAKYDKKVEEQKKLEQVATEEDEDGWITVTKNNKRNPGLARKGTVEQKIKEKMEKNRKKKELKNFYTFQIRESKIKHLANLRQKFEEDKKKINALKQARKFKPF